MSDYGGYKALLEAAREDAKEDRRKPLLECPNDGTPLEFRNGIANCPFGDFRTTRTTRES